MTSLSYKPHKVDYIIKTIQIKKFSLKMSLLSNIIERPLDFQETSQNILILRESFLYGQQNCPSRIYQSEIPIEREKGGSKFPITIEVLL